MTKEIVTGINGQKYELEYDGILTIEARNEILNKFSTCSKQNRLGNVQILATCNTMKKIYGIDTYIVLTSTPTDGQAPYAVQFKKNSSNIGPLISAPPYTYTYQIESTDAGLTGTIHNFTATITDSCIGSIPVTDPGCNITIYNMLAISSITVTKNGYMTTCPISATVGENIGMSTNPPVGGSGSFSYQWYLGTNPISGATSSAFAFVASMTNAGTYSITITDAISGQTKTSVPCLLYVNCSSLSIGLNIS